MGVVLCLVGYSFVSGKQGARLEVGCARRVVGGSENSMFAVIKSGGKQYRVTTGDVLKIESLAADVGQQVAFDRVVAVTDGANVRVGNPVLSGASVKATVVAHGRRPKITIFKMRRRKHFKKQAGHRQNYTQVRVDAIVV